LRGDPCRLLLGPLCMHLDILRRLGGPERLGYIVGYTSQVGGEDVVVAGAFYAAANMDSSPTSFTADPLDTIAAHKAAWSLGLDVVAFYHTHPQGVARPSARDLESMEMWPIAWVIGSPEEMRAYMLDRASGSIVECMLDCSPTLKTPLDQGGLPRHRPYPSRGAP